MKSKTALAAVAATLAMCLPAKADIVTLPPYSFNSALLAIGGAGPGGGTLTTPAENGAVLSGAGSTVSSPTVIVTPSPSLVVSGSTTNGNNNISAVIDLRYSFEIIGPT